MSERVRLIVAAWCVAAAGSAFPVAAQEGTRAAMARSRARIDSLLPLYEAARGEVERLEAVRKDSIARANAARAVQLDSAEVGPFHVVGSQDAVAGALPHLRAAWAYFAPLVGTSETRFRGMGFTLGFDGPEPGPRGAPLGRRTFRIDLPGGLLRDERPAVARRAMGEVITLQLPLEIRDWLAGAALGGLETNATRAYRELATSSAAAARRCFRGDAAGCIAALALADPGPDWSGWYTPAQLRALVARQGGPPAPLSPAARATLLEHALARGGPQAFARLTAAPAALSAPDRIVRAAGGPLREVAATWRLSLDAGRPRVHARLGVVGLGTLAWFALLSLPATRSTRWRLG